MPKVEVTGDVIVCTDNIPQLKGFMERHIKDASWSSVRAANDWRRDCRFSGVLYKGRARKVNVTVTVEWPDKKRKGKERSKNGD